MEQISLGIALALAEVPPEGEDVERETERDEPLDDGRRVLIRRLEEAAEGDGEHDEDEDEDAFEPVHLLQSAGVECLLEPSELGRRCRKVGR